MREDTRPEVRKTQHQYTNDFQRGECDIKIVEYIKYKY